MKTWRLQSKLDRRFKAGHPWVYSNELQGSPKGVDAGEPMVLCDAGGAFLAHGYANAHSLICFRAVSRIESEQDAVTSAGVARRLQKAWDLRRSLGFEGFSCRLTFGEADELPGLIVDRFVSDKGKCVLVVQAQSAGADRWTRSWSEVMALLQGSSPGFAVDAVVIKNDSSSRQREGLEREDARVLSGSLSEGELKDFPIRVRPGVTFQVDLLEGQKTGFFLDQWANTEQFIMRMGPSLLELRRPVRILDLCCYVGQWSVQIAHFLKSHGVQTEITLADASQDALTRAKRNVILAFPGAKVHAVKGDVLGELLKSVPEGSFDVVISDPPALIKNRKDIPAGTHAYLQLHTRALRLLAPGGWIAACSCSGLLTEEAFEETLSKASRRNGMMGSDIQWVARGGQSPDHPVLSEFPEGRYLKAWLGRRALLNSTASAQGLR